MPSGVEHRAAEITGFYTVQVAAAPMPSALSTRVGNRAPVGREFAAAPMASGVEHMSDLLHEGGTLMRRSPPLRCLRALSTSEAAKAGLHQGGVAAAPMPSGVEHQKGQPRVQEAMLSPPLRCLRALSTRARRGTASLEPDVAAAPMPSGVEHRPRAFRERASPGVAAAPMPSGVEHQTKS